MIKKLLLISTLIFFGNAYCMLPETKKDESQVYSTKRKSITIADSITIKEAQLYKTEEKTYLILLSIAGEIFVYDTDLLQKQTIKISKSLLSLRFSSIFKGAPIWQHIAAPITYNKQDYLPIATDNDVYLAKISVNRYTINFSLDITTKIISHNTNIYTVQSFNKDCVISSSTYPTTKFWYSDENKKQSDRPGHMLLGGDTEILYFVKDKYEKDKWERWKNRNEEREGSIVKSLYSNIDDVQNTNDQFMITMSLPKTNSILATHVDQLFKHTCLLLINKQILHSDGKLLKHEKAFYFSEKLKEEKPFKKYSLPETFLNYVKNTIQLHISTIKTAYGSDLKQYTIAVTTNAIYLWQLDLQETTQETPYETEYITNLYQINLTKKIDENFTIQKTIFDDESKKLYIVYEQDNACQWYEYNMPTDHDELIDELSTRAKFIKVATAKNKQSKITKPKKQEPLYSEISSKMAKVDTNHTQQKIAITVETKDKEYKTIKALLTLVNNIPITSKYAETLDKKLKNFSFAKIDQQPDTEKKDIYFTSENGDTVIIHFFGDNSPSNYAELKQKEPQKDEVDYTIAQFALKKPYVGSTEEYIEITIKKDNNKEITADLTKTDDKFLIESQHLDIKLFIESLKENKFNYFGAKYKNNIDYTHWFNRTGKIDILNTKLFFADAEGNHIHVTHNSADSRWKAQYLTKEYLERNPLEKYFI